MTSYKDVEMEDKKAVDIEKKAEEFLKIFKKGEEFTSSLLKENERLRYKLLAMREDLKNNTRREHFGNSDLSQENARLKQEVDLLGQEKNELIGRMEEVAEENKDFVNKYIEVEEENNNLANLYVASYQLHSTLNFDEVIQIVMEIIINLIGGEKFSIMLQKDGTNELVVVASEGMSEVKKKVVKLGDGIVGEVAKTGEPYYAEDIETVPKGDEDYPIVCIPLKIQEHTIGLISMYTLLEQKGQTLTQVDYELFSMLAGHAATAIFSSKLYSNSERKLSTIQGFIELLSNKQEKKSDDRLNYQS